MGADRLRHPLHRFGLRAHHIGGLLCGDPLCEHVAHDIGLLVNFEYPQAQMKGPSFSVPESEIRTLFEPVAEVSYLHEQDILAQEPRFIAKGLTRLREQAFFYTILNAPKVARHAWQHSFCRSCR